MSEDIRLSLDEVYEPAMEVLAAGGATRENAAPVARSIREAEADRLRNIGLGYLLPTGGVQGAPPPSKKRLTRASPTG